MYSVKLIIVIYMYFLFVIYTLNRKKLSLTSSLRSKMTYINDNSINWSFSVLKLKCLMVKYKQNANTRNQNSVCARVRTSGCAPNCTVNYLLCFSTSYEITRTHSQMACLFIPQTLKFYLTN